MTRQSVYYPPVDEPGKKRASWSGSDGSRFSVDAALASAKSALEGGDVKSAAQAVVMAIDHNVRNGRGIGFPTEAPEMRALAETRYHLGQALDDIRLTLLPKAGNVERAQDALGRAMAARL